MNRIFASGNETKSCTAKPDKLVAYFPSCSVSDPPPQSKSKSVSCTQDQQLQIGYVDSNCVELNVCNSEQDNVTSVESACLTSAATVNFDFGLSEVAFEYPINTDKIAYLWIERFSSLSCNETIVDYLLVAVNTTIPAESSEYFYYETTGDLMAVMN